MKKIFLILALTALMSIGANAEEKNDQGNKTDAQQEGGSTTTASPTATAAPTAAPTALADSFMAAFGMEVDAGGSGSAAPGGGEGSSGGTMATGMSIISTTSANQVTPTFTPYSYQK